jgi:multidrug transporter EmrE-like cation transporter
MLSILLVVFYVVFAVGGSTLIKLGGLSKAAALFTIPLVNVHMSLISLIGVLMYGLSFGLYILLLNKFDLSIISPVTIGVVYVLLMITAAVVFNENFTMVKIIGCAMILAGVMLVVTTSRSIQ